MEQLIADLHIGSSDETTDIRETQLAELRIDQEFKDYSDQAGLGSCWLVDLELDIIKAVVFHILKRVIRKFRKENCKGCIGNQHYHQCLGPTPDYFFFTNRCELIQRVLNGQFTHALAYVLWVIRYHRYPTTHKALRGISGAFLHGLNYAKRIEDEITHQSERLEPVNYVPISLLKIAEEIWMG